jgi:pimeloyl-ACP methyl ester carboxylesterase
VAHSSLVFSVAWPGPSSHCPARLRFRSRSAGVHVERKGHAQSHTRESWLVLIAEARGFAEARGRTWYLVSWVENRLEQLASVPILIGWGMRDFVFDRPFLDEWTRRFPRAEVHRFEQAGHYVLEDESEALTALIEGFLR